jgi:hypothetical protein
MNRHLMLSALLLATMPAGALADDPPVQRPPQFEALVRCRAITEDAARLRCFDAAAAALQAATESRDVVVVDRGQVRESRRRLFGLALPRLPIFGGHDEEEEAQVSTVEGVIASATQNGLGQWQIRLQDGAVWMQVDNNTIALRPRPGQPVTVRRAALGSFVMRVNNQPGIRVRRQI